MVDIELILFDLDDTLIYFKDYWGASAKEAFKQFNITSHLNAELIFETFIQKNSIYEKKYHSSELTLRQFRTNRFLEALNEYGIKANDKDVELFEELHRSLSKSFIKEDQDLTKLLRNLNRKYQLGIITNGTSLWQYEKINASGLHAIFQKETIFISEEVGCEKPHPNIYLKALNSFNVKPKNTIYVGDSWESDVLGSHQVGIHAIFNNYKFQSIPDSSIPYSVINNIYDLKHCL